MSACNSDPDNILYKSGKPIYENCINMQIILNG